MSRVQDPRGPDNIEPEVFEALWRLFRRGERDLLEGGVPASTLAGHLDRSRSTVDKVLCRLADQEIVCRVDGVAPDNYRARHSWAPAALLDRGDQQ